MKSFPLKMPRSLLRSGFLFAHGRALPASTPRWSRPALKTPGYGGTPGEPGWGVESMLRNCHGMQIGRQGEGVHPVVYIAVGHHIPGPETASLLGVAP